MKIETNTYTQNLTWTLFPIDKKVYNTDVYTKSSLRNLIKQTYTWNQMLILLDDKSDKTNWEVKISPEKIRPYEIWTYDLCDTN